MPDATPTLGGQRVNALIYVVPVDTDDCAGPHHRISGPMELLPYGVLLSPACLAPAEEHPHSACTEERGFSELVPWPRVVGLFYVRGV